MRSAGNFHPEWGYFAPAPSLRRTLRIAVVAMAVGATAGAAVVVSLVERPAADAGDTSIARHALVTSVQAATAEAASASPVNKPAVAQAQAQVPVQAQAQPAVESEMAPPPLPPTGGPVRSAGASEASMNSTAQAPESAAALAEVAPAAEISPTQARNEATVAPDAAPAPKKAIKKHRFARNAFRRWQPNGDVRKKGTSPDRGLGPLLRRLFSARIGWPSDSN